MQDGTIKTRLFVTICWTGARHFKTENGNTFKVWWDLKWQVHFKVTVKSYCERMLKIDQHLSNPHWPTTRFLCHPLHPACVVVCWPESENRFVGNNAVHDVAGKCLLIAVIALHFCCKSQLLWHLKSDFSQSVDCAEYGTWLQRH